MSNIHDEDTQELNKVFVDQRRQEDRRKQPISVLVERRQATRRWSDDKQLRESAAQGKPLPNENLQKRD